MAKAEWRLPSTRRTLPPLEHAPLITQAWQRWKTENMRTAVVECAISGEPPAVNSAVIREAKPKQRIGAFDLWLAGEELKVKLNEQACLRDVHLPRRPSRHLATLHCWETIHVILNGKADWTSGRFYYLKDYFIVLATEALPERFAPVRTFDLQADLY